MSVFDSFTALDDLAQVIYQGSYRFVLFSSVEFDSLTPSWDLHVGLVDKGKWWSGRWEQKDVAAVTGHTDSETLLEAFAEKLASAIVQGELTVDVDDDQLNVSFESSSKKVISMSLTPMSNEDTSLYLTKSLFALAISAQSRKCRLNPPAFSQLSTTSSSHTPSGSTRRNKKRSSSPPPSRLRSTSAREKPRVPDETPSTGDKEKEKEEEIKALKAELAEARRAQAEAILAPQDKLSQAIAASNSKNTVRLNPHKKPRRVRKMEFEDD